MQCTHWSTQHRTACYQQPSHRQQFSQFSNVLAKGSEFSRLATILYAQKGKGTGSSKPDKKDVSAPPLSAPTISESAPKLSNVSSAPVQQPTPAISPSLSGAAAVVNQSESGLALKILWRKILIDLSSLPRAIALMAITFGLSALGTVIPQNKGLEYYVQNYPAEGDKVLGFLDYNLMFLFELDHIYTSWYFYVTIAWFAASLAACTSTRQWPAVKVAQRWRFQTTPVGVTKQGADKKGVAEVLPAARLSDLSKSLAERGYQVFVKDGSMYAFKGLAGKIGPIGVHAAMLLIILGTAYSGFGGFKGTVMIPEGEEFTVGDALRPVSPIAVTPGASDKVLHVNKFSIDYRPDGSVAQFYSDLSMLDPSEAPSAGQIQREAQELAEGKRSQGMANGGIMTVSGKEVLRKTISVNDPFRYGGVTMYQTDWSLTGIKIEVSSATSSSTSTDASSPPSIIPKEGTLISLPMASLEGRPGIGGRAWASYLPVAALTPEDIAAGVRAPRGVSILARDPESVVFYDSKGQFVGVRRPSSGKPIEVEGVQIIVRDVVGATGLEIKSDPGVPLVYAGFGGLMVTSLVSYLSHSQVWALQDGANVYVAGRSNRAKLGFEKEMNQVLDAIPELPPAVVQELIAQQEARDAAKAAKTAPPAVAAGQA